MSGGYENEYDEQRPLPADEGRLEPPETESTGNPQLLPGIFMIITGVVNLLFCLGGGLVGVAYSSMSDAQLREAYQQQNPAQRKQLEDAGWGPEDIRKVGIYGGYGGAGLWGVSSLITIIGGICMCARKARGLAIFAALVTVLPCVTSPCCLLGLPVGIWSLIVLFRSQT
jgi:hypothetical protein